ncbi:hypothetical protein CFBP6626_25325 (plasmid) [Agrobacterium tumefaciens]|nr:hypothetical protein CFBP6626_25325 [Agrobacterium tumefaciens]
MFSIDAYHKTIHQADVQLLWNGALKQLARQTLIHIADRWTVGHGLFGEDGSFFFLKLIEEFRQGCDHEESMLSPLTARENSAGIWRAFADKKRDFQWFKGACPDG